MRATQAGGGGVVDVWGGAVEAVLERGRCDGVPVRSQPLEYASELRRSPLRACSLPELAGKPVVQALMEELRAGGADANRAEVGAAALCLILGGVDEAHNLVTPHSWASPTTFGGAPKYDSPLRQEAAYCHAIVHRMEGGNPGEFGTGFNNSGYWISSAFGTSGAHAIFPQLREAAEGLAQSVSSREAQAVLRAMGPRWDPRAFNRLCEEALECQDGDLLAFCGAVQAKELELLFNHIVAK